MTLLSGRIFSQQILESLDDGSYIVKIGDVEYRALPPNRMRDVLKLKEENKILTENIATLESQFKLYKDASERAEQALLEKSKAELEKEHKEAEFWMGQFYQEQKLRQKFAKDLEKCTGKIIIFRLCTF